MKERIAERIVEVLQDLAGTEQVGATHREVVVTATRDPRHGDFTTNVAMRLAGRLGRKPRELAAELRDRLLEDGGPWTRIEIAGPGFLNFSVSSDAWLAVLREVLTRREAYGRAEPGSRERIQIEFVSANPTGPMNVVSARAGAVGDSLARILRAAGYVVETEFYVNDAGNQVRLYGHSIRHHLGRLVGREIPFPTEGYRGEYLESIARALLENGGEELLERDDEEAARELGLLAARETVEWQKRDLEHYRVSFDRWFHEVDLHVESELDRTLEDLRSRGVVYERDGAVWLRTSEFGDSEDRVLVKSDGEPAYLMGDIAYHRNKLRRGYDRMIDIWGPDHHGHVIRMQAAMRALGVEERRLEILIVQQVNLLAGGERVKMSKRAGEFVTLDDLVQDVGVDPARFFFVMRKSDSHLDFDLDLARKQSKENPVYNVQYVHARVCSLMKQAREVGLQVPTGAEGPLHRLELAEEQELLRTLARLPGTIQTAARLREVHRIPYYLSELAGLFHNYYFHHRFIGRDPELSLARLKLAEAVGLVIRSGLSLLGIEAPETM